MVRATESEADFSTWFEAALHLRGWRFAHFRTAINQRGKYVTAMSGHSGFPDYVCVRDGRVLFVELKREKGQMSDEQKRWIDELDRATDGDAHVWRPSDRERIMRVLEEGG